ncbi:MAG: dihydrodipicolinate reductase [Acidimicrobiales bacterium]
MGRLRVVQWATGNIGTRSLEGVLGHPDLQLVGVHVYDPEKVGRDAGELAGLAPTGVLATGSIDDVLARHPDCVLYMPRACDVDEVARLLAAGSNVVTTRGEFHRPASMDPTTRGRIEAACQAGRSSIHSTGSSPGFITEALPIVLTSIQRRLDRILIEEFADLSQRPSPELLFDVMGFGREPTEVGEGRLNHGRVSFGPSLHLLADALGMPLDDLEASGQMAVARHTTEIAAGTIEAGLTAAQRTTVTGVRDGRPFLEFRATWYCSQDLDVDWELGDTGWRVTVDGDAPLKVALPFPFPMEEMAQRSPGYTANRAVNAVPVVCAAEPGIRTTVDLPQIIARFGL